MAGGKSHFYSLEYEGENSIFNLLFTGGNAPPVPHGCTHADDLIYLLTTGLFDRKGDDLKISQDMSHLWANLLLLENLLQDQALKFRFGQKRIPTI